MYEVNLCAQLVFKLQPSSRFLHITDIYIYIYCDCLRECGIKNVFSYFQGILEPLFLLLKKHGLNQYVTWHLSQKEKLDFCS